MDQRIIIVVGPDMTGKTQIAKALADRLGIAYFKASSEHQTYLTEPDLFLNQLTYADPRTVDILRQTGLSLVMDRGYPCEWVYSMVLGRKTDVEMIYHMDKHYASLGARIVVCYRESYKGIVDDIDPTLSGDKLERLDHAYKRFVTHSKCETMLLDVDDEDLKREIEDIVAWLPPSYAK